MRWKRKKEVTSETASCFSLNKRRYIFCRKSFFTTKYLKKARKRNEAKRKKKRAKRSLYLFASTDVFQMFFLWRFFLSCPLMFLACCSTDVCCLQVATDQDFKQTYNTLKTEVELEIEANAKSKLKSKLRSKPQPKTEIEIEADWKLKSKSKLRSTTEIEIEIEIDYWKRVQNGNRLRSRKDFSKSTSSPVSRTSGPNGFIQKILIVITYIFWFLFSHLTYRICSLSSLSYSTVSEARSRKIDAEYSARNRARTLKCHESKIIIFWSNENIYGKNHANKHEKWFFSEISKIDAKYSARNHARALENVINRKSDRFWTFHVLRLCFYLLKQRKFS